MITEIPELGEGVRTPDSALTRVPEDWDWEAFRVGGKLYLYCYLRETVLIALTADGGN